MIVSPARVNHSMPCSSCCSTTSVPCRHQASPASVPCSTTHAHPRASISAFTLEPRTSHFDVRGVNQTTQHTYFSFFSLGRLTRTTREPARLATQYMRMFQRLFMFVVAHSVGAARLERIKSKKALRGMQLRWYSLFRSEMFRWLNRCACAH